MKNIHMRIVGLVFCFLIAAAPMLLAAEAESGHSTQLTHQINLLVFQISIIILAAWLGGEFFRKLKFPAVLGEIIAGVVVGPYCLGKIPLMGFEHGIFPLQPGFPISTELYGFAAIASIILLFYAGLETDIDTFLKFSLTGTVVGIGGVVASFFVGDILGVVLMKFLYAEEVSFFHAIPLFLGVISTATSVGISARILTSRQKMNSPEGVTILSAAVIDDVLGIIILSIIIGMAKTSEVSWGQVGLVKSV
ncbi:MAG: cation:proton antiporter, partial [Candidatus Omnitrophica bacterium]|nr:cation:proton antiporter [Candidatus Omnitrophota bacterium]